MPTRRVASRSNPTTSPSTSPPAVTNASSPDLDVNEPAIEVKSGFAGSLQGLWTGYLDQTPSQLKLIDGFMLFLMLTGIAQFAYCVVVTNYPFNAFLGGFAATLGQFVLCGALRIQSNPLNKDTFPTISPERAFGDFLFGSLILHFFVWNYLG